MENSHSVHIEERERRATRRFPFESSVHYTVTAGPPGSESGLGRTVNLSSTGVLFSSQTPLYPGERLQLSISWPVQLNGNCGLKLVTVARVVRCTGALVAAQIEKYEFRTQAREKLVPPRFLAAQPNGRLAGSRASRRFRLAAAESRVLARA